MNYLIEATWLDLETTGRWDAALVKQARGRNPDPAGFPSNLLNVSTAYDLREYQSRIAETENGAQDIDYVLGLNGVNVGFRGGVFVLTHDYYSEGAETLISPEDLVRLIDWRIAIIESDDFNNPDADFGSIEVDLEIRDRSES